MKIVCRPSRRTNAQTMRELSEKDVVIFGRHPRRPDFIGPRTALQCVEEGDIQRHRLLASIADAGEPETKDYRVAIKDSRGDEHGDAEAAAKAHGVKISSIYRCLRMRKPLKSGISFERI